MLVSSVVVYGAIAIVALVVLGTVILFKWGPRRSWIHWAAAAASAVLGSALFLGLAAASHVVRVTSELEIEEGRVIGSATEVVGGHDVELVAHGSGVTLILNGSERELEVRTLVYGDLAPNTMVPPDALIDPFSVYTLHANLDYLGPDHRPPDSVSTKGGGKVQYWLTW
ncbi:MAG: hypothetical protein IPQ07_23255 [Myxococcales bacterium]|nr:hypothetical protein [Myxococcales bacterium]